MAAQANIVINDGKVAPLAHTFVARGASSKLAEYKETASGISIGMPKLTMALKETNGDSGKSVVEGRLSVPVMEVISGADGGYTPSPKVAYTMWGVFSFTLPNRSTLADRKDILALVKNAMANAAVTSLVQDLERPF